MSISYLVGRFASGLAPGAVPAAAPVSGYAVLTYTHLLQRQSTPGEMIPVTPIRLPIIDGVLCSVEGIPSTLTPIALQATDDPLLIQSGQVYARISMVFDNGAEPITALIALPTGVTVDVATTARVGAEGSIFVSGLTPDQLTELNDGLVLVELERAAAESARTQAQQAAADAIEVSTGDLDPASAVLVRQPASDLRAALLTELTSTRTAPVGKGELMTSAADYGVIGDGVTDDTAALTAALAATPAGGTLFLHPKRYRTTAPVPWPSGVTIDGGGRLATIEVTGNYAALTLAAGARQNVLRGVRFVGTMPVNGVATLSNQGAVKGFATATDPLRGLRVLDCEFNDLQGTVLNLKHLRGFRIAGNDFSRYGYAGAGLFSAIAGSVTDNDFTGTGVLPSYAVNSYAAFTSIFEPDGNLGSAANPRSEDVLFQGNTVRNQAWEGLDTHAGRRISFIGNTFIGCSGNAIAAVAIDPASPLGCREITIASNTIVGPGGPTGTARMGIVLRGQQSGVTGAERATGTITGNTIRHTGDLDSTVSGGIVVANAEAVVVSGNTILECRSHGIIAQDSRGTIIQGNTVVDVWKTTGTSSAVYVSRLADTAVDATLIGNVLSRGSLVAAANGDIPAGSAINLAGYNGTSTGVTYQTAGNFFPVSAIFSGIGALSHVASLPRGRREALGIAPPTSGQWQDGDVIRAAPPVAGGYIGWVCTSTGTPGTWKGFGLIQA